MDMGHLAQVGHCRISASLMATEVDARMKQLGRNCYTKHTYTLHCTHTHTHTLPPLLQLKENLYISALSVHFPHSQSILNTLNPTLNAHTQAHTQAHTHAHTQAHTHAHTLAHGHTPTHTHTHTNTHTSWTAPWVIRPAPGKPSREDGDGDLSLEYTVG